MRREVKKTTFYCLTFILVFTLLGGNKSFSQDQANSQLLREILSQVSKRIASYPDFEKWQALVVSTYINADKNWQPEKTRRVKKLLKVNGRIREEEILEAVEIEKGQTRDITEEYRRQRLERLKKLREEAEKANQSGEKSTPRQLTKDDLIPFTEKKKDLYTFSFLGEEILNGEKVYVIEARAKVKKEDLFEGRYYLSQKTYDPLRLVVHPAKNPSLVKEFQVEVDLEPWQDGLVLKKSRIKVFGGFLVKFVRLLIEEDYSDFKVIV